MTRDEYEEYIQRIPYDAMGDFSYLYNERRDEKCEDEQNRRMEQLNKNQ